MQIRSFPCVRSFLFLLAVSCLPGPLAAQVSFRTTAGDTAPAGLYYLHQRQDVPVQVQSDLKSLPYPVIGSSSLTFYTLDKAPDGRTLTNPVAAVNLESAGSSPLLIFFKGNTAATPYRILPMKEDLQSFPGGACRFANFSAVPVNVSLGGSSFPLPCNGVVDRAPRGITALLNVSAVTSTGANISLINHNMLLDPEKRFLFLVVPDKQSRAGVAVKLLSDHTPSR
jgi:hypothetical protein